MPTSGTVASKGTVSQAGNVLTWSIAELRTETATLKYTATHDPTKSGGVEQVNTSVTYSDAEGHTVTFPNPSVNVHGCAAAIELTPPTATNELTTGASHTVTATITGVSKRRFSPTKASSRSFVDVYRRRMRGRRVITRSRSDMKLIAQRGDKVDLALVPIGGHYTMDRFDASERGSDGWRNDWRGRHRPVHLSQQR